MICSRYRVTRWVCEKVAQYEAQPIICQNYYTTVPWKKVAKIFALFCNFQNTAQRKQLPNRPNFAQCGHPVSLTPGIKEVPPLTSVKMQK
jgi:hypothetical protein